VLGFGGCTSVVVGFGGCTSVVVGSYACFAMLNSISEFDVGNWTVLVLSNFEADFVEAITLST
jgi:hypothetical protein